MVQLSSFLSAFIGITAAGVSFYFLSKYEFETNWTYEQKYSSSVLDLNGDSNIWKLKIEEARASTPDDSELRSAAKVGTQETLAALKKVCDKIYKTDARHRQYLNDFKRYCTKHNEDVVYGRNLTVIREGAPEERNNLIDSKIEAIKKQRRSLDEGLTFIKYSQDNIEDSRSILKSWCTRAASSPYEGSSSTKFLNFLDYCVKERVITI
ncbi:hypothetical protein HF1_07660 [Mycoplasma haemofelis str. Langford 1]|uniref:Uncharacterized protein n=1 Tax=Mycoplasma haemofelis (strain Langford 1) TaxID=941640 RepID=E8ZI03_MYCHL|nr:hypothetical protein [Mycoplasma haemofelis]CBY92774.1 hypothetical protein HF1_07660 [Mycoplasma haemofelis str. Langford 1]